MDTARLVIVALTLACVLVALAASATAAIRSRRWRWLRVYQAVNLLYLVMIYGAVVAGVDTYILRSGILSQIGVLSLSLIITANIIAAWDNPA